MFVKLDNSDSSICSWVSDKPPEATHAGVLQRLGTVVGGVFRPQGTPLSTRRKGNLGEFLSFFVGEQCDGLAMPPYRVYPMNALNPFDDISLPGVDIVWVFFGDTEDGDHVILQEVKTTSAADLRIASDLTEDYARLFGTNPEYSWANRLAHIQQMLELFAHGPHLADRMERFLARNPQNTTATFIHPTLVFDSTMADPQLAVDRLKVVKDTLIAMNWPASTIAPLSIALDGLDGHLARLLTGR